MCALYYQRKCSSVTTAAATVEQWFLCGSRNIDDEPVEPAAWSNGWGGEYAMECAGWPRL